MKLRSKFDTQFSWINKSCPKCEWFKRTKELCDMHQKVKNKSDPEKKYCSGCCSITPVSNVFYKGYCIDCSPWFTY